MPNRKRNAGNITRSHSSESRRSHDARQTLGEKRSGVIWHYVPRAHLVGAADERHNRPLLRKDDGVYFFGGR